MIVAASREPRGLKSPEFRETWFLKSPWLSQPPRVLELGDPIQGFAPMMRAVFAMLGAALALAEEVR